MVTISLQDQSGPPALFPSLAAPFNRVLRSDGFGGIGAEHFAVSLAELWSLPVGEEFVETVEGEI